MIEWYTSDHLPQPNIPLLAYYENAPQLIYVDKNGDWRFWWGEKAANPPDCWRYLPPRPRLIAARP